MSLVVSINAVACLERFVSKMVSRQTPPSDKCPRQRPPEQVPLGHALPDQQGHPSGGPFVRGGVCPTFLLNSLLYVKLAVRLYSVHQPCIDAFYGGVGFYLRIYGNEWSGFYVLLTQFTSFAANILHSACLTDLISMMLLLTGSVCEFSLTT